jgi:hypothetical protein
MGKLVVIIAAMLLIAVDSGRGAGIKPAPASPTKPPLESFLNWTACGATTVSLAMVRNTQSFRRSGRDRGSIKSRPPTNGCGEHRQSAGAVALGHDCRDVRPQNFTRWSTTGANFAAVEGLYYGGGRLRA